MSQAAWKAEQIIGNGENADTAQDVSNPALNKDWADSSETMKALTWQGKNSVKVGKPAISFISPAISSTNC